MKAAAASDRWGCSHSAPAVCPWCQNPDAEVWRSADDYVPIYGIPAQQQAPVTPPALTLAEQIELMNPGFWERGATA